MSFKILVCVKQVPDTSDIKWTINNTIQREGLDSIINPFDAGAISFANEIKQQLAQLNINTHISVVSMGPKQADKSLRTALALGADKAYLLCDNKFSGSDTLATSYTLSQFIKTKINKFDIILCGQQAIDGDTAQVPSELAQKLNIPEITYVTKLLDVNNDSIVLQKETSKYSQKVKCNFPLLISTTNCVNDKIPCISDYMRAQDTTIKTLNSNDINAANYKIGLLGSPTQVKKAFKPSIKRVSTKISNKNINDIADYILNEISKCKEINN